MDDSEKEMRNKDFIKNTWHIYVKISWWSTLSYIIYPSNKSNKPKNMCLYIYIILNTNKSVKNKKQQK